MKGLIKVLEKKETNANERVNNVNDIFMDVESEKYMVTVTSNEDYQKLKEQCKSSLERLK